MDSLEEKYRLGDLTIRETIDEFPNIEPTVEQRISDYDSVTTESSKDFFDLFRDAYGNKIQYWSWQTPLNENQLLIQL